MDMSSSNSNRLQTSNNNIDRELKRQSNFDLSNLSEGIETEIEKNRPWLTFKPDSKTVVKMDPNNGLRFESEESPFKNDKGENHTVYHVDITDDDIIDANILWISESQQQ